MFAPLIGGFREIRLHLFTGYCTLFVMWLWLEDQSDTDFHLGDLSPRLAHLLDSLGTTAQLSLLTFAAVLIGGFLERAVVFAVRQLGGQLVDWGDVPALCVKEDEIENLERIQDEADFRLHMLIVLVPTLTALAFKAKGIWWGSPLLCAPVAVDRQMLRRQGLDKFAESVRLRILRSTESEFDYLTASQRSTEEKRLQALLVAIENIQILPMWRRPVFVIRNLRAARRAKKS